MSNEVAVMEKGDLLSAIVVAAKDPGVDAAKINALLDIKIKMDAIEAENKFWDAMRRCQNDMEPIRKDAKNPENHSKYAKVSTIQRAIQPIYRQHEFNLSFTAKEQNDPNVVPLKCVVSHSCGHREIYELAASIDNKGAKGGGTKTEVQGTMSTSSYLRRKLYELIFDLILTDDDDDGNLGKRQVPVTQAQADTLDTLLNDAGMTTKELRRGFYAWAEVNSIKEVPAHKFEKAVIMLQAKVQQRGGGK